MELQRDTEPGVDSSNHTNLNELSISELVGKLRITCSLDVFDNIEKLLVARDARLKAEIASLQKRFEMERMQKIQAEEELNKREEQCLKGKRAQEYYEKLLKEVKKNGLHDMNTIEELRIKNRELVDENCKLKELNKKWLQDSNVVAELRIRVHELEDERVELEARKKDWEDDKSALDALRRRNCELEEAVKKYAAENDKSAFDELRVENTRLLDEKCKLEALVESKERKFWELNEKVLKLEDDVKLLMSVDACDGGGKTEGEEPQADPEEKKELNEMNDCGSNAGSNLLQRNEDTPHSVAAGRVQLPSKVIKDAPAGASAMGRSGLETIVISDDDDDDRDHDRTHLRMPMIEMLKRKFSFSDTCSSSSGSSSGSYSDSPLNIRDIAASIKKSRSEVDSPALNTLPR